MSTGSVSNCVRLNSIVTKTAK